MIVLVAHFPGGGELAVPFVMDLLLPFGESISRGDVADRQVQADGVVVSHIPLDQAAGDLEDSGDLDACLIGELFDWQAELERRMRMLDESSTEDGEKDAMAERHSECRSRHPLRRLAIFGPPCVPAVPSASGRVQEIGGLLW